MNKRKIIIIHFVVFILLSSLLYFVSKSILKKLLFGILSLDMWIEMVTIGTLGVLILTTLSCLSFLKQKRLLGILIIIINSAWLVSNLYTLYEYIYYKELLSSFYIPNWVLLLNSMFAISGVFIGLKLIQEKAAIRVALPLNFSMILVGLILGLR